MKSTRRNKWRPAWAQLAGFALLAASLAPAQTQKSSSWRDDVPEAPTELDLFMGGQLFHKRSDPLQTKLLNSTVFGLHFTQNIWTHWSLEESMSGSTLADLTLLRYSGAPDSNRVTLEQRVWTLGINPVYHFTPRAARLRPFLTGGFTEAFYTATKQGKFDAAALTPFSVPDFGSQARAGANFGGGIKYRFTDLIGMRVDFRGLLTSAPTWNMPNALLVPGMSYIPKGGSIFGMQATAGILFSFGGKGSSGSATSHHRGCMIELEPNLQVSPSSGGLGDVFHFTGVLGHAKHPCTPVYSWTLDGQTIPGSELTDEYKAAMAGTHTVVLTAKDPGGDASATARGQFTVAAPPIQLSFDISPDSAFVGEAIACNAHVTGDSNSNLVYTWTIDGVELSDHGSSVHCPSTASGSHSVSVSVKDPSTGATASAGPKSYTLRDLPPFDISMSEDHTSVKPGESVHLKAQAPTDDGQLTYTWTTTAPCTIRGDGPTAVLDTSNVQFDPANVFKPETRTCTVTLTVSDTHGRSKTAQATITITKDPQSMRLDDLIFSSRGSRVNNCAKRILIDELQTIMNNNPDVQVLLVGHEDAGEATVRGKNRRSAPSHLDRQRVINAAAVMTAGTGVCAKCDLSRIMVSYAGTDQSSESKAGFCGTSSRAKTDERKSDEIAADDAAAKNRRVEIWIVPKGVAMPSTAPNPEPAPVKAVQAKGCPH